jgi:RimJ/RimL family protein N-acetyltransferase
LPHFDEYKIVPLATPNLTLEPLIAAHADELFAHLSDPAMYTYVPQDPPRSLDALRERYMRLETRRSPEGDQLWLNWLVRQSTAAAGLMQATCSRDGKALIAYEIFVPFQQRGIAAQAVAAMLAHLQQAGVMEVAVALVDTRNERSIRLLEKLGFVRTKFLKDADRFKGSTSDEYEYRRD